MATDMATTQTLMKLINNLELKPFLRIVWANEKARHTWEKEIQRISQAVQESEIISVAKNQRLCAWHTSPVRQLPAMTKKIMDLGLSIFPIQLCGHWGQGFIHYTPPVRDDDPNPNVSVIICRKAIHAKQFQAAYNAGNHIIQGKLLGFPACCTKFYSEQWQAEYFDPIWQMTKSAVNENVFQVDLYPNDYLWSCLPILRYIGLRVGFHIPCSFDCKNTKLIAVERFFIIDNDIQILLESILRMPMQWQVYRGIATIKTPIFTVITQSVPSQDKYTINLHGDFWPREGSTGINFPYLRETK